MASTSPHPEVQFFGRSLDIINPKHTQIAKWYEILLLFWRWWLPSQHSHFGEVQSWEQTEAFQKVQVNFQTVSPENTLNVMLFLYSFHIVVFPVSISLSERMLCKDLPATLDSDEILHSWFMCICHDEKWQCIYLPLTFNWTERLSTPIA